jgi:integrase
MLRSFLVATGVLPERNERLHAFEQWILRTSQTITDDRDRRSFTGFARWRHLRKARGQDRTEAQFAGQRRELAQVRALLHILHAQGLTVNSVEQATMDGWLAGGPAERHRVKAFLEWCRTNGTGKTLKILPPPASGLPTVFLTPEHERAMLLGQILDPQKNIEPGLRLAAGLVIIYGFRSHEIRGLSLADITFTNETVWIRFGHEPLRLPEELGEYARQAAGRRRVMRFGGNAEDMQWLFPGPLHGHPIGAPALRKRLAVIGIRPHAARATALGQLAQQLPPPILARLTGLAPSTTVRWNAAVAASYGRNLPSNAP